jgi:hypothetical protein
MQGSLTVAILGNEHLFFCLEKDGLDPFRAVISLDGHSGRFRNTESFIGEGMDRALSIICLFHNMKENVGASLMIDA